MTSPAFQLDLDGRRVVVVGGGAPALDRVHALAAQGARVRVISPNPPEALRTMASAGRIDLLTEAPRPEHLDNAWLVTVRCDEPEAAAVLGWARDRRIWCDAAAGDATPLDSAALGHRSVAVWSDSDDPEADAVVTQRLVDAALSGLSLRRPTGGPGRVVLVGGGPGDMDLLTVRGRLELAAADVIVTDRLGPVDVLGRLDGGAEIIDVGKEPYRHPVPQDRINEILVDQARAGRRVVRLKGGDPFVFGRGGEEVLACRAAGVPVTVVPGVTSAFSAPLAADIPVTHRGHASGVIVLSGHDELAPELLAAWPGTIVVLMGMARLGELAWHLIDAGKDPVTPAAVVTKAWTPAQQHVRGTLADIQTRAAAAGLTNPAVIVIGDVVSTLGGADG